METNVIYHTDCLTGLRNLSPESIDCCVTSPPYYGLRDYGVDGQIGLEASPSEYIDRLCDVFRHVRRVMKPAGTLWVNIGDSYAGSGKGAWWNKDAPKEVYIPNPGDAITKMPKTWDGIKAKDLIGIPWMLAFALRADGWYLRADIIWHKTNPMPESVTDRPTKSHEYLFLLSKSPKYYYDYQAVREKAVNNREMRNKRDVWTVPTQPLQEAHFAVFPERLIVDCIKAGCPEDGIIVDPFMGAGTTALVARKFNRRFIGFEINSDYIKIADKRLKKEGLI